MYHGQRSLLPKHNTAESMVGLLPLAPHHDLLQYIHHVPFNANGVKTGALQVPTRNTTKYENINPTYAPKEGLGSHS